VHNLRAVDFSRPDSGYDWARRFDETFRDAITGGDPTRTAALDGDADYRGAVPTPDHFLPALYLAGLADAAGERPQQLIGGCIYGSLSMAAYTIGIEPPPCGGGGSPSSNAPEAPPECANI
jgi:4,5-DOPA dioxygenase extradiol